MTRTLLIFLTIFVDQDNHWQRVAVDRGKIFEIRNERKLFTPLYSQNRETIDADLVIDGDTSKTIRMAHVSPFPMGDTVKIEVFDITETYTHSLNIVVLNGRYYIDYNREVNFSDEKMKFKCIQSAFELDSDDFSSGRKIRGHVNFIGACMTGCFDKNSRIQIDGNFTVKVRRY